MPLTGIDDAWQTRLPQGWTQLPDGSYGPSSDLPDWLKQLIPSPGAATPIAPGLPSGAGPQGYMPGGGVMGRQAVTPGAPSMGFPAQGGPDIFGPRNSPIPPYKSVGPFTGGTSTENMPGGAPGGAPGGGQSGGGSSWDPRSWFRANPGATFQQGQPMGPDVTGGGFNPLSALAGANPYARGAIAAAGVMAPTPAGGPDAPTNLWMQRPSGVGGMPGPQVGPAPYDPLSSIHSPGAVMANAPPGQPSDTPRPGGHPGPGSPMPPRRPKNGATPAAASRPSSSSSSSSNPRFGTVQYQVPGSGGGPLSRSPIYTTLNLFGNRS
jgi:hypothetical protein